MDARWRFLTAAVAATFFSVASSSTLFRRSFVDLQKWNRSKRAVAAKNQKSTNLSLMKYVSFTSYRFVPRTGVRWMAYDRATNCNIVMNFSFNCMYVCVLTTDCLWHSYCFPSTSWCPNSFLIYFISKATDRKLYVCLSLSLCVYWKSQVVKFYRKFDHSTLTLAQNVREEVLRK